MSIEIPLNDRLTVEQAIAAANAAKRSAQQALADIPAVIDAEVGPASAPYITQAVNAKDDAVAAKTASEAARDDALATERRIRTQSLGAFADDAAAVAWAAAQTPPITIVTGASYLNTTSDIFRYAVVSAGPTITWHDVTEDEAAQAALATASAVSAANVKADLDTRFLPAASVDPSYVGGTPPWVNGARYLNTLSGKERVWSGGAWHDYDEAAQAAAATAGEGAPLSSRNRLRNAQFGINQRALSGTVTLAAGQHGHDGVKGGASGATYTFAASGIDTTITVTAGSIILPIASILMEGGVYTLSHAGTAQARVWQGTGSTGSGAYAGAPFQTPNLTANTQTNVEFSTGTVLRPQFEPGAVVTTFERRRRSVELLDCQDYYFNSYAGQPVGSANPSTYISQVLSMTTANNGFAAVGFRFPTTMRAAPTLMIWAMDGASGSVSANGGVTTAAAQPASISRDGFLSVQNLSGAAWTAAAIKFGLEASAEI